MTRPRFDTDPPAPAYRHNCPRVGPSAYSRTGVDGHPRVSVVDRSRGWRPFARHGAELDQSSDRWVFACRDAERAMPMGCCFGGLA